MQNIKLNTKLLLQLLSYALNDNAKIDDVRNVDWEQLYIISKKNSVSNLICYAIDKLGVDVPKEIYKKFKEDQLIAIRRDAIQEHEIKNLLEEYEKNGIECIVLKGLILKKLFASSDMRIMGDLDLLLKKEFIPAADSILIRNGYTEIVEENQDKETNPHEEYKKPPIMLVELHKFLFPQKGFETIFEYYESIWDRTVAYENYKNIHQINDEEFYIYMILHIMKHYKRGGTGVRSLIDVWVFISKKQLDWEYINKTFAELNMSDFEKHIRELVRIWFGGKENSDTVYDEMTEFILDSGTYGNEKNFKTISISKENNGKSTYIKHMMKIVFIPYKGMRTIYPILNKLPFLLPVFWVVRIFDRLLNKRDKLKDEVEMASDVQYLNKIKKHLNDVGL